jgi:hypothetical protein
MLLICNIYKNNNNNRCCCCYEKKKKKYAFLRKLQLFAPNKFSSLDIISYNRMHMTLHETQTRGVNTNIVTF